MELKVSSQKAERLSRLNLVNDPVEKELSDDDNDDDRNHKHRRRENQSQSLETDPYEQNLPRHYRNHNKPFENGRFDTRRPGLPTFPRATSNLNQRIRGNQTYTGTDMGRGRDSDSWSQRDTRFGSVDIASQMFHHSPMPNLLPGRGLADVSNAQSAPWGGFGSIPGIPSDGVDTHHSIGIQGTLGPAITHPLNMGIPRQRCRDFEERGFCLRGDMCPMEHGVNRIVIEDVQGLSQFNLPVSLPSAHLLGTPGGTGSLPSDTAPSGTSMNSRELQFTSNKHGIIDDGLALDSSYDCSEAAAATDVYDPDQPLWINDGPETSAAIQGINLSKIDEAETLLNNDPSYYNHVGLPDYVDNESEVKNTKPIWGRINNSKNRSGVKESIDSIVSSVDHLENEIKAQDILASAPSTVHQGRRIGTGSSAMDSSQKGQNHTMRNDRKPSQKALRTLFVKGIPQENNKRKDLLAHFRKFGTVVDIYIPSNGEQAFVQFSKREEADAALKAPDAVMGNRFIKLWWANRDSIPDDGSVYVVSHGLTASSVPAHPSIAARGEDKLLDGSLKGTTDHVPGSFPPNTDHLKPVILNGPTVSPPFHKQLEELRKKQELLDEKRKEFQRELEKKLQKQGTRLKSELVAEQTTKRPKIELAVDVAKPANLCSTDPGAAVGSPLVEGRADKNKSVRNAVSNSPKANTISMLQQSISSKNLVRPPAPVGSPFLVNRYKLDNRPTAFRINNPLPDGFANVSVLKEHFSPFGELSSVGLEDLEASDGSNASDSSKHCAARITYTNRRSAEWAFADGKCWEGHNLQFKWLTSNISNNNHRRKDNAHSASKEVDRVQSENLASISFHEAAALGNVEADNSERKTDVDMQLIECSMPGQTVLLSEDKKSSPKGECNC